MSNIKSLLRGIDNNRGRIMKFFITCAVLEFVTSTLYRIVQVKDSRTQIETIINLYSLLLTTFIFTHEVCECLVPRVISENLKMITHYQGKGALFIIISFIYFSPTLDVQQNYSAYLLFFVGLVCLFADCRKDAVLSNAEEDTKTEGDVSIEVKQSVDKKFNPYDIPDDF
jgi:hypothetical protein